MNRRITIDRRKILSCMLAVVMTVSLITINLSADKNTAYADPVVATTSIDGLNVNYQVNPIGIANDNVRFGWKMNSNSVGEEQTSYRIVVSKGGTEVWDSGVVESGLSTGIAYEGSTLALESRYDWKVTVTDNRGKTFVSDSAYFETGTDFDGAKWIIPTKSATDNANQKSGNTYTGGTQALAELGVTISGITTSNYGNKGGNPLIRTEATIDTSKDVASARLYMTGLGNYEAYVNGDKPNLKSAAGEAIEPIFAPGWTDYRLFTNYQTYDVTSSLQSAVDGKVVIGAEMSKGPYAGRVGNPGNHHEVLGTAYGSVSNAKTLALLAKLVVTYDDGSQQVISTDPGSWKSIAGPILFNDYYNGELYDANRAYALNGWNEPGFNTADWYAVDQITDPLPTSLASDDYLRANNAAVARYAEEYTKTPVSGFTYYPAENQTAAQAGGIDNSRGAVVPHPLGNPTGSVSLEYGQVLSLDLGQNIVGVLEFEVRGDADAIVRVRHGEMLNDNSSTSDAARGTLYYGAMRGADGQNSFYKLRDTSSWQKWRPKSAYNGFQHVEISLVTPGAEVTVRNVKGKVITSVQEKTGNVETSDANLNQLISNIYWGQMGNLMTIPTDCPQRTERCGWTGDIQIFAQTALFNSDTAPFLDNYTQIADANFDAYDAYGAVMPRGWSGAHNSLNAGWSDVGVALPWTLYQQTGDTNIIKRSYATMDKYMDRVYGSGPLSTTVSNRVSGNTSMNIQRFNMYDSSTYYGDWLAFRGAHLHFVNTIYQIYTTQLMEKMAIAVGDDAKAAKYHSRFEEMKNIFLQPPTMATVAVSDSASAGGNPLGKVRTGGGFVYDDATAEAYGMESGDLMSYGPIINNYITGYQDNAQTALAWALKLGLYKDETHKQHLIEKLIENIKNEDGAIRPGAPAYSLGVGFLGVNVILPATSSVGESDIAYSMLLQDEVPGWMAVVKNGGTTMWERWDSYSKETGFGASGMNSFNHFANGSSMEWLYEYVIGIQQVETAPGFKEIVLQPEIDTSKRVTEASGDYDSYYGKIESAWKAADGKLDTYTFSIPANTTAKLYLPVDEAAMEGFADIAGLSYRGVESNNGEDVAAFDVKSGGYILSMANGKLTAAHQAGYETLSEEKTDLQILYGVAGEALADAKYTTASKNALQPVYDAAGTVIANTDATAEEVEAAAAALETALQALKLHVTDDQITVLNKLLALAAGFDEDSYTSEVWTPFAAAVDAIETIVATPADYSIDQAQTALTTLATTINNLQNGISANKYALRGAIAVAEATIANADNYIKASIDNLKEKLAPAKTVEANANATQEEVDAAYAALQKAIENVYEKGDTELLSLLVSAVSGLTSGNFTPASWATFSDALDVAEDVLDKADPTKFEVDAAYTALTDGLDGLVVKANIAALQSSIVIAQGIIANRDDYVPSTLTGLSDALDVAVETAANPNAAQSDVNAANSALNAKISAVRLAPNKSALLSAQSAAARINKALYTTASVQALESAISAADAACDADDASQAEVDRATLTLNIAIASLVTKPTADVVKTPATDKVTAPDTSKNTVSTLNKLTKSTGKLSPKFLPSKTTYKLTIAKGKASVKITAFKENPKQKIQIKVSNGKYRAVSSVTVKVKKGKSKTISINVTSESGAVKTYKIKVIRKK